MEVFKLERSESMVRNERLADSELPVGRNFELKRMLEKTEILIREKGTGTKAAVPIVILIKKRPVGP